MEHVIVRRAKPTEEEHEEMLAWRKSAIDGDLFDMDVLSHGSSFLLCAVGARNSRMAYLPVQQPLMLESYIASPWMHPRLKALALTRMVEHAISEAYHREAAELYFLSRNQETAEFAKRHHFKDLQDIDPGLRVYRLNLLETFGA